MSQSTVLTATCTCGSLQLSLHGPPDYTYLCHCLNCRKETGTLFATQVKYPRSSVKITRGADLLTKYSRPEDKLDPDTGVTPNTAFCGKCGSPVWCEGPDAIIVRYGLIDTGTEDAQMALNGTPEGTDEKGKGPWWPRGEYFCKRKAGWAEGWSVDGAQLWQELEN